MTLWKKVSLSSEVMQEAFILEGDVSLLQGHVFDGGGISL